MSPQSNVHHESQEKAPGPWTGHQIGQLPHWELAGAI